MTGPQNYSMTMTLKERWDAVRHLPIGKSLIRARMRGNSRIRHSLSGYLYSWYGKGNRAARRVGFDTSVSFAAPWESARLLSRMKGRTIRDIEEVSPLNCRIMHPYENT